MKILAIMQNQWLKNAAHHNRIDRDYHERDRPLWHKVRKRKVAYALFAGCQSGRRLKKHLGAELCERIVWEESHWMATETASGAPGIDIDHIKERIEFESPDVILCIGRVAQEAIRRIPTAELGEIVVLNALHPAGRDITAVEKSLSKLAADIPNAHPLTV